MTFRRRILLAIFTVGLLPSLIILLIAAFLLNSTIDRVGAVNLENSIRAASEMTADSENALALYLRDALNGKVDWTDGAKLNEWMNENHLDLAFKIENGKTSVYSPAGSASKAEVDLRSVELSPGVFHLELGDKSFACVAQGDSLQATGCGIIMPAGYAGRGRFLSNSLSTAASLDIYKKFSLKLLAVITAIIAALVIAVGGGVSMLMSRRLVKPLEILAGGAERIGGGDLGYRVNVGGSDEFSGLAESFNSMASSIKENQARLLEAERLAAWRDVARRIAHEIRNPLTPITVELFRLKMMLTKAGESAEEIKGALKAIESQIDALRDLSGQFSMFAKEPELKKTRGDIREIILNAISLFANYPNAAIITEYADDLPPLKLDSAMMGRLFNNLIKNSIEAAPKNVKIRIKVDRAADAVRVVIRDNGPGFPSQKLVKIDQPYITTKGSGTGLGMAISKKIVEEHGGAIRFFNDNGAVAEITIPVD